MQKTSIVYLPIGRKTFNLEAGEKYRKESQSFLESQCSKVYAPNSILTSVEDMESFINGISKNKIDIVVYQSITFADAEFVVKLMEKFSHLVIVWSVREPDVGGRLHLNSLTGGNSTCHTLKNHCHPYRFIFGNPNDMSVQQLLRQYLTTEEIVQKLYQLTIGVIGEHPPGFYFSSVDEKGLEQTIGAKVHQINLPLALEECVKLPKEEWLPIIEQTEQQVVNFQRDDNAVKKFAQFTAYIKKYIDWEGINALAIRNWPEFFTDFGAAAGDSSLSYFTEKGISSANESDIHGSISMYILQELGGSAPYLGDMVHINEENNSVTFWHDGAGAFSLADPKTGAVVGVHPNRKLGPAMDFGLKAGQVTIMRLSKVAGVYRMVIMKGKALDTPQQFAGTSVEVELENDVKDTVYRLMTDGLEPHYALIYADVVDELIGVGRRLGIKIINY